ncbi:MAG: PQQ-binding-like beta-propeller repeat protein [Cellulomonas sp.]|uniref:outer membrane protein assembly factor BamB family protein n=1 Tax=Cellulomonas sp. TaxID=40001 RepID=UPI0019DC06CE|nr:PQQ-binding-like beta-propeller repeat protein [Cellulomonas sp.]MBF0688039.1 PQQ-binding-like beta-propeller repeat protein [Cellulomonas sp.]
MPRRRSLQDVELVDDLHPGPPTDAPAPDRSGRRRVLVLGAALLAVLVAVGVIGQVVVDRRESARFAAIATDPGSIDPVREPPTAGWQVPDQVVYDLAEVRTPDGLLVGVRDAAEGPVRVAALDIATGDEVWEVDLLDGTSRPDPGTGEVVPSSGRCEAHETQGHLAVCLAHDGTSVIDGLVSRTVEPSAARLVTLDTRDGTVVTDLTDALGTDALVTSFATTGDLVVVTAESAELMDVRAVTSDGTLAWRTTAPAPDDEDGRTVITSVGDLVALVTRTEVRLLDAAGDTVRTVPLDGRFAAAWSDDALYVVPTGERPAHGVEERERTTVVRPEGDVELQGRDVLPLAVDDGSVPGLVLTSDGTTLTARDGAGQKLWAVSAGSSWLAVLLDGRLHLTPGAEILTIDARTGDELWRSDAATSSLVTDGRLLLAVAASPRRGHSTEMVALDPADGAELWRAPLPESTQELTSYQRLLFAVERSGDTGEHQLTLLD